MLEIICEHNAFCQSVQLPLKAILVEVQIARELDREIIEDILFQKVWIGWLSNKFESYIFFDIFEVEQFAISFVCEMGEAGYIPYAESLVVVADDRFSFMMDHDGRNRRCGNRKQNSDWKYTRKISIASNSQARRNFSIRTNKFAIIDFAKYTSTTCH